MAPIMEMLDVLVAYVKMDKKGVHLLPMDSYLQMENF
jgi:hypothetical protein